MSSAIASLCSGGLSWLKLVAMELLPSGTPIIGRNILGSCQ